MQDIFDTLPAVVQPVDGEGNVVGPVLDDYGRALVAPNDYFAPKVHILYERTIFRRTVMLEGESVAAYVTRLKRLAESCDIGNEVDNQICDQLMERVTSATLRKE